MGTSQFLIPNLEAFANSFVGKPVKNESDEVVGKVEGASSAEGVITISIKMDSGTETIWTGGLLKLVRVGKLLVFLAILFLLKIS